jgi:hypothetical protein
METAASLPQFTAPDSSLLFLTEQANSHFHNTSNNGYVSFCIVLLFLIDFLKFLLIIHLSFICAYQNGPKIEEK